MIHAPLSYPIHQSLGSILFVSGLGLVLGVRHSTDADHLVAMSTLVVKQRSVRAAALIGSLWGVGHTITIFIVGSLIILFHVRIPARLGLAMEFSVAVMLVVLGLLNLTGVLQHVTTRFTPSHQHGRVQTEATAKLTAPAKIHSSVREIGFYHSLRPLVVGLVHGLAGSAAVALLVLSTIPSPFWAAAYLLIFGVGTILGMMLMTTAVAVPLAYNHRRFAKLNENLATASGIVSLCFGSFLIYELGFVGGLFTHHPHWIPQ